MDEKQTIRDTASPTSEADKAMLGPAPALGLQTGWITLNIEPIGKPRMTRKDRWAKRKCVVNYHQWRDNVRLSVSRHVPQRVLSGLIEVSWIAFLPIPKSWSNKKKRAMAGKPHRAKPDRDNIDKALLDALLNEDSGIAAGTLLKYWDDGNGSRITIRLGYQELPCKSMG